MPENCSIINFYRVGDPYGWLSNFAPYPVLVWGQSWPTSEHYFQAQKFKGTPHEEQILALSSPMEAAKYGRRRDLPLRQDWEQVKDDMMRQGVRAKFRQHEDIRRLLIDTGNAVLVEHTANDNYWADGGDGSGKNMLGQLLMQLRQELAHPANASSWKNVPMPGTRARLDVADIYTAEQFGTIGLGLVPEEMEDKWFICWEEPWLHIHHSWTTHEIFRVRIEAQGAGTFAITEAFANRDPRQYNRTDDAHDAQFVRQLIRGVLLEEAW